MSILLIVAVQLLVPLAFAADLAFVRRPRRAIWALQTALAVVATLFVLMISRWDALSYFLLLAIPVLLVVAAFRGYRRITHSARPAKRLTVVISVLFIVALGAADGRILSAYFRPAGAVDLLFPLANGVYYVGGGGNSRLINSHQAARPQRFAIDILKLNAAGRTSSGFFSRDLESFAIFGEAVLSPCDGTVVVSEDGHPDHIPPERDRDSVAGNHVVIACSGIKVLLGHLQQGSIFVIVGQAAVRGTRLGRVGNSGNTSQPHLHIHAERGGPETSILENEPVPVTYEGRFLVRNSVVFR